jgi:hypothetical protein
MAYESTNDSWTYPCDLCGSVESEQITLPTNVTARRCYECGLITIPRASNGSNGANGHRYTPHSLASLRRSLRSAAREGAESVLFLGTASLGLVSTARDYNLKATALIEPDASPRELPDVIVHQTRLASAPFLPDQFDVIVCAGGPETMDAPSTFFERCRTWLVAGGLLLVGSSNWRSLPARLWRRNWMRRNMSGVSYLLTPDIIRAYADRYGYEIRDLQTHSSTGMIANVASPDHRPSRLLRVALAPVAVASGLLRMGDEVNVTLIKRGVAMRPLMKKIEEDAKESPGLAPAMYSGVNRTNDVPNGLEAGT